MLLLMSNTGSLGLVVNVGNQWIDQPEETKLVGKCTNELWLCASPHLVNCQALHITSPVG